MKKLFSFMFALLCLGASAQISGKYVADRFPPVDDSLKTTTYLPIEIGGENYYWALCASWVDTSRITTSTVRVQVSPDDTLWIDHGACDSLNSGSSAYFSGETIVNRWMRLKITVTSGDTIEGFRAWYEFKRK